MVGAFEQASDSKEEFLIVEGLDHIIVCPCLQSSDPVLDPVSSREDEDGGGLGKPS